MLRGILKIVVPCLLLVAVLAAARYMDSGRYAGQSPSTLQGKEPSFTWQDNETEPETVENTTVPETEPVETEPVETESVETEPVETEPMETETAETESVETEPVETAPVETEAAQAVLSQEDNTFVFTFLGDCTLGTVPSAYYAQVGFVKTVGEDYLYPFANVRTYMENDDFTFLNLEGPLTDTGYPGAGRYTFRGPEHFVNILSMNSVEGVTLANNHTMDYGAEGINNTRKVLNEANVSYVEKDCSKVITLESGLTVGLYATMYASVDKADLVAEISAMKEQGVDVIIYAPHWGTEGSYRPNEEQKALAYAAIDAGANIVFGTHPHVLQPIEEYNGGVIYYSLANFSFGGNTELRDMDTVVLQQEVVLQPDGTVKLGERTVIPCSVSSVERINNYQPTPYAEGSEAYIRTMTKISGTFDGPDLPIA